MSLELELEPKPAPANVYKILTLAERALLKAPEPAFITPLDTKDGYVHTSTRDQVLGTLQRFFGTADEIILLEIPYEKLLDSRQGTGRSVKWEAISSGAVFPHIYPEQSGKGILLTDIGREWHIKRGDGWTLDALDA